MLIAKVACAEPNYEALASAIRVAEGNSNYGVLTHYKHTSYRSACKNTCRRAYRDYINALPRGQKGHKKGYVAFLGHRYCPVGAKNDPKGLNRHWIKNVTFHYKGGV